MASRTRRQVPGKVSGAGGGPGAALEGVGRESGSAVGTFTSSNYLDGDEMPAWIPPAMRYQVATGVGRRLVDLTSSAVDLYELRGRIAEQVSLLRGLGASWAIIGLALGVSAEGARSRYGRAGSGPGDKPSSPTAR